MRVWVAMFVMLAFAGCSEEAKAPVEEDDVFDDFEVDTTGESGIIRGIIVDQAIYPVFNAKVTIMSTGETVFTNVDGAFAFGDLDEGTYFLEATGLGYNTQQTSIDVVLGEEPPILKIQLTFDPESVPYYKEFQVAGFIQCGTNVVALCGGVRDFTGLGDDTYSTIYDTGANITHLQTEMVWENTQSFGDAFSMTHRYATQENYDGGFYDGSLTSGSGPSPLLIVTNAEKYNAEGVGADYKFMTSIFAGTSDEVPVFGLAVSQSYEIFIHEFHGYAPPEGWRFTQGAGVPGPL